MQLHKSPSGLFILLLKQYSKPIADFLVSLKQFYESKHQHVTYKATSKQGVLPSLYSKGQAVRIIFYNSRSDREQSSNKQEQKQQASVGEHSSCPERNQELVFPNTATLQRTEEMTSRSLPANYTVQLTNTSGDCKFPTLCET